MPRTLLYRVDLTKIEGEGDFPCPSCGNLISPDDDSGLNYEIVDIKTDRQGRLRELIIVCKKCRSEIHLEGFELLDELEEEMEELEDTGEV